VALPAPRLLLTALLAFGLTACTATVPASPHPQWPTVPPAADETSPPETTSSTPAPADEPTTPPAPTPVSRPVAGGSVRRPAVVPVVATPVARPAAFYADCAAARTAGAAPIYRNQPGYRAALDRDSDGIACEVTAAPPAPRAAPLPVRTAAPTTDPVTARPHPVSRVVDPDYPPTSSPPT
jgi:Excalibur calcium-binding domain